MGVASAKRRFSLLLSDDSQSSDNYCERIYLSDDGKSSDKVRLQTTESRPTK